jgi:ABC-type thiamine transport system ATPase subunit
MAGFFFGRSGSGQDGVYRFRAGQIYPKKCHLLFMKRNRAQAKPTPGFLLGLRPVSLLAHQGDMTAPA